MKEDMRSEMGCLGRSPGTKRESSKLTRTSVEASLCFSSSQSSCSLLFPSFSSLPTFCLPPLLNFVFSMRPSLLTQNLQSLPQFPNLPISLLVYFSPIEQSTAYLTTLLIYSIYCLPSSIRMQAFWGQALLTLLFTMVFLVPRVGLSYRRY